MSTAAATTAALESSYKATLHSLSLILSFHASLNSLSVTSYARHAPRALTGQLQLEAGKFDAVCSELEGRIRQAIATLERDLLKARGQPIPSDEVPAVAEGSGAPKVDSDTKKAAPRVNIDLSNTKDDFSMDVDDSFLHTSLFGESTVTSPVAMDATSTSGPFAAGSAAPTSSQPLSLPSSAAPAPDDFSSLLASLSNTTSGAPLAMPLDSAAPPLNLPLPDFNVGSSSSGGGEADLNAMLAMLSGSGMAAGITAPGPAAPGMEGLSGLDFGSGSDFDLSALGGSGGDYGEMDASSLDELLKSLGGT